MNRKDHPLFEPDGDEIVVGVDGSPSARAAIEYALAQAAPEKVPVHLIHAVPFLGPVPPLGLVNPDTMFANGQELLNDRTRRARMVAPAVDLRTTLHMGTPAPVLINACERARLLVLGRGTETNGARRLGGSTVEKVTIGARCPVRVVPGDWRERGRGKDVVVGVKDPQKSDALLTRAFQLAEASGGIVVVVHAWKIPAGYESLLGRKEVDAWTAHAHGHIRDAIGAVRRQFPDVPMQIKVVPGTAVDVLTDASEHAALLLVGRHTHPRPFDHLGGVARGVQRSASCPVETGPPETVWPRVLDMTSEEYGALLR